MQFRLISENQPKGDQPQAIEQIVNALNDGTKDQVLLGITGSRKTFSIANVIDRVQRPTLVLAHNKTLAAQLYQEFKNFFPENAVEYFVSYYDYYQPEAYVPASDTYIEKETSINEEIDRLRLRAPKAPFERRGGARGPASDTYIEKETSINGEIAPLRLRATKALFERRDVIIVASVSCIYGLGSPEAFFGMLQFFAKGDTEGMDPVLKRLVDMQYERTNMDLYHGSFRVRGDVLEILPAYEEVGLRVEYFGDEIERITRFDVLRGDVLQEVDRIAVYPRTHYVTPKRRPERP